ncbi:MAG TPA: AbrB/MazE/SpoVT family DNA-binding domain-containing protein [Rhodocyclaceae bacterium]|nr:AbrB/MazE/SpoVT family DNA-binding domain-containing protein [Rhodocyclaceae bacterium]
MSTLVSRVFTNGNSQAVRIPQEFRLDTRKVEITRTPDGDLIIHPIPVDRGTALLEALAVFDEEFVDLLEEDRKEQLPMQEREDL